MWIPQWLTDNNFNRLKSGNSWPAGYVRTSRNLVASQRGPFPDVFGQDTLEIGSGQLDVNVNFAYLESLLYSSNNCFLPEGAGWKVCKAIPSAEELRTMIETDAPELKDSCYECALQQMAGMHPISLHET